jgi:hypothetical protein
LNTTRLSIIIVMAQLAALSAASAQDADAPTPEELQRVLPTKPPYSPAVNRTFPTRPLFGDTHLHTAVSLDAGTAGARLMPDDAYRFAKGERVVASSGQPVKLSRPLDFLVVADHSDNMGFFPKLSSRRSCLLGRPHRATLVPMMNDGKGMEATFEIIGAVSTNSFPPALTSRRIRTSSRASGTNSSTPPKLTTTPAVSPPSSDMSGRRRPPSTSTAT